VSASRYWYMVICLLLLVSTAWAAEPQPARELAVARGGFGIYQVNEWGLVQAIVENPNDQAINHLLTVNFDQTPLIQFGKRVWVPAHSKRVVVTPVYPTHPGLKDGQLGFKANQIDDTGPRDVIVASYTGAVSNRRVRFSTGMIQDSVLAGHVDWPIKAVGGMRSQLIMKPAKYSIAPANAPAYSPAWNVLDGLVISRYDVNLSGAQRDSLRQWLIEGGRIWIMLDQVNPNFPTALLGEAWDVSIIDRVSLTSFEIKDAKRVERVEQVQLDYPIDMLRVVAPSMEVMQTVRGYPTVLRQSIGKGEVLVTTLFARGYMSNPNEANDAMKALYWFMVKVAQEEQEEQDDMALFEPLVQQQIGYTVMSRQPVLMVLVVLTALLLVVGMILMCSGRLEYLGPIGSVLALLAAAVLIGAGLSSQGDMVSTATSAQLVEFAANEPFVPVKARVGIYNPLVVEGKRPTLGGEHVANVWPNLIAQSGGLLRMIWTDANNWHFDNLTIPPGAVTGVDMTVPMTISDPPRATLQFDGQELTGSWHGGEVFDVLSDPLIATPAGALAIQFDKSGKGFTSPQSDTLSSNQFILGALNDTQRYRQDVYRKLLKRPDYQRAAVLLGWTEALPLGLDYTHIAEHRGQALMSIPLTIKKPQPG
jgi:hypothetical protein